jgi:hypothetical protein
MTELTADEITTFAELFGHELTVAQMTHLEEWVTAHRDEAIVMHQLDAHDRLNNVRRYAHLTLGSISVERRGMAEDLMEIVNGFPPRGGAA